MNEPNPSKQTKPEQFLELALRILFELKGLKQFWLPGWWAKVAKW